MLSESTAGAGEERKGPTVNVAELIVMGLDINADHVDESEPPGSPANLRATDAELVKDLVDRIGIAGILSALREAAVGAADIHDVHGNEDPALSSVRDVARELRSFAQSLANAVKVVA